MSLEPTVSVVFLLFSTCLIGENLKQEDIVMPPSLWCLRSSWASRLLFSGHSDIISSSQKEALLSHNVTRLGSSVLN